MEMLVYYFIVYYVEAFVLGKYCSSLFTAKSSTSKRALFLFILYSLLAVIFSIKSVNINALLFSLVNFIFLFSMYDISFLSSLFHTLLISAIMGLTELVPVSLLPNISNGIFSSSDYKKNYIIIALTSKTLYAIFLYLISHIITKSKEPRTPFKKEFLLVLTIPCVSVWIVVSLLIDCITYQFPSSVNRTILICSFLLLVINLMAWVTYSYMQRKSQEFTRVQLQMQKDHDIAEYYKMLSQQHESQQILIHDIKKHLHSLALLNEQGETERISGYIQKLIHSSDLEGSAHFCENDILNAILYRYSSLCKQLSLNFHVDIRSGVLDFIDDEDMTSLFCNLLDNAREAASNYPHSYIELNVHNRPNTPLTIISMINSCRINPFDKNGQLRSRKADTLRHGFGMKSVERMVAKYNGEMNVYYKDEDHTFHTIILFRGGKIDTRK